MSWFVYIARDNDELVDGVCNDLIAEESLLCFESNWTKTYKIVWFIEFPNKIEALTKLKTIGIMSDAEKLKMISESQKIIIMSEEFDIDNERYPLVCNLKYTLSVVNFLNVLPELWKLNDIYVDNVAEYLAIKRSQIEYVKLWDISIDVSKNVGIITKEKFYPIIKC